MPHIFIAHSDKDRDAAEGFASELRELGFSIFAFRAAPNIGDDIPNVVEAEIARASAVLVLWSAKAVQSVWVRAEGLRALELGTFVSAALEPVLPPIPFNAYNAPDLSDWAQSPLHPGWAALVEALANKSADRDAILLRFSNKQAAARAAIATQAVQPPLPDILPEEPEPPKPEPLAQRGDIDLILDNATAILGTVSRQDLTSLLLQATIDQEMLRDAAFVVAQDAEPQRPIGATYQVVRTLAEAIQAAQENALIVIAKGVYSEAVTVHRRLRIAGLGTGQDRPLLVGNAGAPAIRCRAPARLENLAIEVRAQQVAVYCEAGEVGILRCDIQRYSESTGLEDAAIYIAGAAELRMIAGSLTTAAAHGLYFVGQAKGILAGVHITVRRAHGLICRGKPILRGCALDATGGHAILAIGNARPVVEDCDINGRGAAVIRATNTSFPKVKRSRISSRQQLAFDFNDRATGVIESNIIAREEYPDPNAHQNSPGFLDRVFRPRRRPATVPPPSGRLLALALGSRPVFVDNVLPDRRSISWEEATRLH